MTNDAPDWQGLNWKIEATPRFSQIWPTGRVLWQDKFDTPTHGFSVTLNGGTVELRTDVFFTRPSALLILSKNDNTKTTYAEKFFGQAESQTYGLEFAFSVGSTVLSKFTVELRHYDGTHLNEAGLRYVLADEEWQYLNSTGNYVDVGLGAMNIEEDGDFWYRMKFIADFNTNKYVRMYLNDQEFDLSALTAYSSELATGKLMSLRFSVNPRLNSAQGIRVDNIIMTEEEAP